jgi:hypothetical protein
LPGNGFLLSLLLNIPLTLLLPGVALSLPLCPKIR